MLSFAEQGLAVAHFDYGLLADFNAHLTTLGCSSFSDSDIQDFDRIYGLVQRVHGDFFYLLWRTDDRNHKCSIALTEDDLDLHVWLGTGETPALALASALLKSLHMVTGRDRLT